MTEDVEGLALHDAPLPDLLDEAARELQDAWLSDPPREPSLNCALPAYLSEAASALRSLKAVNERLQAQMAELEHACAAANNFALVEATNRALSAEARLKEAVEVVDEFSREYDGFENGEGRPCPTLKKARAVIRRARSFLQSIGGEAEPLNPKA